MHPLLSIRGSDNESMAALLHDAAVDAVCAAAAQPVRILSTPHVPRAFPTYLEAQSHVKPPRARMA